MLLLSSADFFPRLFFPFYFQVDNQSVKRRFACGPMMAQHGMLAGLVFQGIRTPGVGWGGVCDRRSV